MAFETLNMKEIGSVAHIELNRPEKANAFNAVMWKELKVAFDWLSASHLRVGVLSAQGKHFCAGVDLDLLLTTKQEIDRLPEGRRQERVRAFLLELQSTINAAEQCSKPVLAAIHGACVGAGVDLVTACDMRYSTREAKFSVKEVDMAIVPDVGTLQRLPRLIGEGQARELAYTGRDFDGNEARAIGLVNGVYPDRDALMSHVQQLAAEIANKSPLAIRGIKATLNYSRDHPVAEGLEYIALRNAAALFSKDLEEAITARSEKREPKYPD